MRWKKIFFLLLGRGGEEGEGLSLGAEKREGEGEFPKFVMKNDSWPRETFSRVRRMGGGRIQVLLVLLHFLMIFQASSRARKSVRIGRQHINTVSSHKCYHYICRSVLCKYSGTSIFTEKFSESMSSTEGKGAILGQCQQLLETFAKSGFFTSKSMLILN